MSTELRRAPHFQLVRDDAAGVVITPDNAVISLANYPESLGFRTGAVDHIALYWDAKKVPGHLAAAGDTINLDILVRNTHVDDNTWIVAASVPNLGWRQLAIVPVLQSSLVIARKAAVTVADAAAGGFQIWAVKLTGQLGV